MENIEYIRFCPVCNSDKNKPFIQKHGLGYYKCKKCRLIFANPRPSSKTINERVEMFAAQIPSNQEYLQDRLNFQNERVNLLKKFIKDGKILDFGCGDGSFVRATKNAGYDALGVEKSRLAADFAKKYYDVDVLSGAISEMKLSSNTFAAITLWDVLEHLPDPVGTCKILVNLLSPNGYLFIFTPHNRGLSAILRRGNWWVFGPNDHLCLFSIQTIKFLIEKINLQIISLQTKDLVPWHEPGYSGQKTIVSRLWQNLSINKSFLNIITMLNLGDWILVIAKKDWRGV